jgi:antitoxin ParD1/3/4
MKIHLTPDLERLVTEKVESGQYQSPSDVICEALWLLKDRDDLHRHKLEELRREIQIGLDQIDRGEYTVYDENSLPQMLEEIKAKGREKLARKPKDEAA